MKSRKYRLHPCFFGTCDEVLKDCSPTDPSFPSEEEDPSIPIEHRNLYVRGPVSFITDNPGQQRIGSFHPLDEEGWSVGTYISEARFELFRIINEDNLEKLEQFFERRNNQIEAILKERDLFARNPLSFSLVTGSTKISLAILKKHKELGLSFDIGAENITVLHYCVFL